MPGRTIVSELNLRGVSNVDSDALRSRVATRETSLWPANRPRFMRWWRWWWVDPEYLDPAALTRDQARVQRFYQARGYYDAHVARPRVTDLGDRRARVDIDVSEGAPTLVEDIRLRGCEPGRPDPFPAGLRAPHHAACAHPGLALRRGPLPLRPLAHLRLAARGGLRDADGDPPRSGRPGDPPRVGRVHRALGSAEPLRGGHPAALAKPRPLHRDAPPQRAPGVGHPLVAQHRPGPPLLTARARRRSAGPLRPRGLRHRAHRGGPAPGRRRRPQPHPLHRAPLAGPPRRRPRVRQRSLQRPPARRVRAPQRARRLQALPLRGPAAALPGQPRELLRRRRRPGAGAIPGGARRLGDRGAGEAGAAPAHPGPGLRAVRARARSAHSLGRVPPGGAGHRRARARLHPAHPRRVLRALHRPAVPAQRDRRRRHLPDEPRDAPERPDLPRPLLRPALPAPGSSYEDNGHRYWPLPSDLRFVSGGSQSNRGYPYGRVGVLGTVPIAPTPGTGASAERTTALGGTGIFEASAEARWQPRSFGMVAFLDISNVVGIDPEPYVNPQGTQAFGCQPTATNAVADGIGCAIDGSNRSLPPPRGFNLDTVRELFTNLHPSVGVGLRYLTPIGPL
ncbi:MAG: BamA/TamA family outer membrane protein, partial [Deltaproteobacteria bacterium]|nr:BamA/TamA family outer membrane protein [Deltaproteobacteria bacterium]